MAGSKGPAASSKAETKAKQKIIEDKTFGLKNKNKSAKISKYVTQLEQNMLGPKKQRSQDQLRADQTKKKEEEEKRKAELAQLFKPVIAQPKIPFGTDPKSVLCAHFKAGQCSKGDKCKFSHDLAVERKSAKPDLYTDAREAAAMAGEDGTPAGTSEYTNQEQLERLIAKKHGGSGMKPASDIVCKFFIEAVQDGKYGWFWECPNGGDKCQYRHALPPGFQLKKPRSGKDEGESEEEISLEEFLEVERQKLHANATAPLTPITEESFQRWKEERKAKAKEQEKARIQAKQAELSKRSGVSVIVSGRELFEVQPELFQDDDQEEAMDLDYTQRTTDGQYGEGAIQNEQLFLQEDLDNLSLSDSE